MSKPMDGGRLGGYFESDTKTVEPKQNKLPQWRVLLHDDEDGEMLFVVQVIMALTPLDVRDAAAKMLQAHRTGLTQLLTTHRERAELYIQQFARHHLDISIEPAD